MVNRIRITLSIDKDVHKQIEDFRFDARFKTMSGATEDLLIRGLRTYYGECVMETKEEE